MAILPDILRSWRDPKGLILDKTAQPSEPLALATLMGACGLMFVAQWPEIARLSQADAAVPMDARIGASLMAVVFVLPLVMYGVAGLVHLVARALGGTGTGFDARMSLFQPLLSCSPLFLLNGLVRGLIGPGGATFLVGAVALAGFVWMWSMMLRTVERR